MPRKARYQREKSTRARKEIIETPSRNIRNAKTNLPLVRELARTYTADAIEQLAKIMRKSKYPGLQLAAIEQILNRGWGKPANTVEGGEGAIEININEIRRTIVDPVGYDDEDEEVSSIEGKERADMETIKERVRKLTTPKKKG